MNRQGTLFIAGTRARAIVVVLALVAGLLVTAASPALATDRSPAQHVWVKVADDGLAALTPERPQRSQVDAIIVHADAVYIASHHNESTGIHPWVFRSRIHGTHVWEDLTPEWGLAGEIVDLVVFDETVFAAMSSGQLWRFASGSWQRISAPTPDPIRAMAVWSAPGSTHLCLAHAILTVSCSSAPASGDWTPVREHPEARDASIASVTLASFRDRLYVGFGGMSAGGRECEVWSIGVSGGWTPLTPNCFGRPGLTWVSAMQPFQDWLYIGTAGHGDLPVIMRTRVGLQDEQDVTPHALYPGCAERAPGAICPLRYGSMTATSSTLYVGTRTTSTGDQRGGDVLARDSGGRWVHSNDPGFGETNDTVTAMASQGIYVYAGTINIVQGEGFQVWRRTPTTVEQLGERIPALLRRIIPADLINRARSIECFIRPCPLLPVEPFDLIGPIGPPRQKEPLPGGLTGGG